MNIRVITATNQELEGLVSQGTFRKDLYYRINVARVHIPSLRDRKEDISCLLDHYIRELNAQFGRNVEGFTDEALEFLLRHDWPGNVRELKNLLEAVFIDLSAQKIALTDLPKVFRSRVEAVKDLPRSERDRILSALFTTNWNKSKAAQKLRWSRMTLYRKLEKLNITRDQQSTEAKVTGASSQLL